MTQATTNDGDHTGGKYIRHNVPSAGDKAAFVDDDSLTLHVGGVTVYFDGIRETPAGYTFQKDGRDVAFIESGECDVSPVAALNAAQDTPNEKVPFADD